MNLTNDNPVGCQQIASCGGLDAMATLIVDHFPIFDSCLSADSQAKGKLLSQAKSTIHGHQSKQILQDQELDFLVAILGLLVNLVEKDSQNRSKLVAASVPCPRTGNKEVSKSPRELVPLLCSIFLANQGAGDTAGEGKQLPWDDESTLLQGEREAKNMIVEAYAALLLAFLSTESAEVRDAIASCLPDHDLEVLVPVLERFLIGTDIEDFKCSWLVVQALECVKEDQKKVLYDNYGKSDAANVAKVKELRTTDIIN